MAHISLQNQTFFTPPSAAGGRPTSRNRLTWNGGPSVAVLGGENRLQRDIRGNRHGFIRPLEGDVVVISSDSESDYGDLDDGQSDTSFPPVDELLPPIDNVESSSVAGTGKSFNPVSGRNSDGNEPSATGIANSEHAVASSPSLPSPKPPSSPVSLQTELSPINRVENSPGASPALRNSDTACDSSVPDTPGPFLGEDVAGLHWSGLQRDPELLTSSHGENSQPRENLASLDPDEWDKKYPFSPQAIRRRMPRRRVAGLSEQQTRSPEHSSRLPATAPLRASSGSPRAVQRDEPVPQGRTSCEEKQTSTPGGTTSGRATAGMAPATDRACRTSDATEPCGKVNSDQYATAQTQTTWTMEQLQAPPPTSTIPEGLLQLSGAQRKEQDPSSPAGTAPCEAGQVSEDTTRRTATEIADAESPEGETQSRSALSATSPGPPNDSSIPQSMLCCDVVSKGSDGAAVWPQVQPILEARYETLAVDVQRPPEGIESGQGGGGPGPVQASDGKPSSPPPLRFQDTVSEGAGNDGRTHQVLPRRSQRKAAPCRRITDLTEDEDDYMAETGGKNSSQTRLGRRRRRRGSIEAEGMDIYQPPDGSERGQDEGGDDIPLPPRKRHRTAARRQIRSIGDAPGTQQVYTSHLAPERPSQHKLLRPQYSPDFDSSDVGTIQVPAATFQEWPLHDAVLKRAVMNGVATFQVQFTWDPCMNRDHKAGTVRDLQPNRPATSRLPTKGRMGTRTAWTLEEENLVVELKEQGLAWNTIYKHFKEAFPATNRRVGNLQVRYYTKLKKR